MMPPNSADSGPAAAVLLLMCCCCVPILCALAAAIVAFYVFGIMFLVQDQDVCSYRSPLWIWGVCTLSLNCFVGLITPAISPRPNPEALAQAQAEGNYQVYMAGTALQTIPTYVLSVALTISGLVIIYGDFVCSEMKTVGLYEWSQFAVWILFTIACCGFGGFLAIPEYYEVSLCD